MERIRRYTIPESRLPFVNAEVEKTTFQGRPHLVSSIWGGAAGGRIYFWNPDTGSKGMRRLPDGLPGAYMLRTGSDGRLYLGCGNGDLARYDSEADRFETLVTGELTAITWGGCVTDRVAVWAATPGHVGVYDYLNDRLMEVYRPLDSETPTALYGHHVVKAPDGRIVVAMDVPQARLILLDLDTKVAQTHTPPYLEGVSSTGDAIFLDDETLAVFVRGELHLVAYPSLELKGTVPRPDAGGVGGRACVVDGRLHAYCAADGGLYALDLDTCTWTCVADNWSEGGAVTIHPWDQTTVCGVTVSGEALRFDTRTGATDRMDLEATGPMHAHGLCAVPHKNLIVGAPFINQRFWTIDSTTGEGQDRGRAAPGGGQINQIIWEPLTGRALMSSYTTSTVTAYDPSDEDEWPDNPIVLASAHSEGQMRPTGLAHDGEHVWMASSPEYGTLGGALSRIDPRTGEIRIWRHLVLDQKVNAVLVDPKRRRVYCSTEIYADCNSAPPTRTTGQLVAFDTAGLQIARQQAIQENVPAARVLVVLPSGEVLAQQNGQLYAWDAESGDLRDLGPAPSGCREAVLDRMTERLWTSAEGSIGWLELKDSSVVFRPEIEGGGSYLQIVDDKLYYAAGSEVCVLDLDGGGR